MNALNYAERGLQDVENTH